MSTQLRLVDPPARRATGPRRARAASSRGRRTARWDVEFRLDTNARRTGRAGVAAAREALSRAADQDLREAS